VGAEREGVRISRRQLERLSGPFQNRLAVLARRSLPRERDGPGRVSRFPLRGRLESLSALPGRKLRDLLFLGLDQAREGRNRFQRGRRDVPGQERLKFASNARLELDLRKGTELTLDGDQTLQRRFRIRRSARCGLRHRQPSKALGKKNGIVEEPEGRDPQLIDRFGNSFLPVGFDSGMKPRLIEVIGSDDPNR
jgi:hypothetical protein